MIKIYGSPRTSAKRCFWMLEEAGLKYERQQLDMQKKEHKSEAFLKLNPNGKVPCLVDGDFIIWESMAINHYISERYARHLLGQTPQEHGHIHQWSYWALAELQPALVDVLIQKFFVPEDRRDHAFIEKRLKQVEPNLEVLERTLNNREFLTSPRFSLADLNVASVVNINSAIQNDISKFTRVSKWLKESLSRPAALKVAEMS